MYGFKGGFGAGGAAGEEDKIMFKMVVSTPATADFGSEQNVVKIRKNFPESWIWTSLVAIEKK